MLKLLTCERGHFWEANGADGAAAATHCPECGAPAESLPLLDLVQIAPAPPPAETGPPPLLDTRGLPVVAGFEVREDLGRSANGARLYRAEQTAARRDVLLTVVLAREDSSQQAWGSLRGEARALSRVWHPCFPVLYDTGQRERQLFFNATSACGGMALSTFIAGLKRPLPHGQMLRLMEVLARAVVAAHEEDQLHRHLHPGCIALLPAPGGKGAEEVGPVCQLGDGYYVPQIRGLGLARRATDLGPYDAELYEGEPGYLSPEQAWGRSADLGPATDIYGLGGILYFLLTGRPPFKGPSLTDTLDAIQTARLLPPGQFRRTPEDLELIARRCLARIPGRRYRSALELADDLHRARASRPLRDGANTATTRLAKWFRRGPARAALIVVLFLSMVAVLLAYRAGKLKGEGAGPGVARALAERDDARREAQGLRAEVEELREAEEFERYRELIGRALAARDDPSARRELDECEGPQRRFEWYYLHRRRVHGVGPVTLADTGGRVRAAGLGDAALGSAASPVALVTGDRQVRRWWPGRPAKTVKLVELKGTVVAARVSPHGRQLAVLWSLNGNHNGSALQVYGWPGLGVEPLYSQPLGHLNLTDVAYSPDCEWLVAAQSNGELHRFQASSGQQRGAAVGNPRLEKQVRIAYHPGGGVVAAFVPGEKGVEAYELDTGRRVTHVEDTHAALAIAYSPDGLLAVGRADKTVALYQEGQSDRVALCRDLPGDPRQLAFSADGKRLAVGCDSGKTAVYGKALSRWVPLLQLPADGTVGLAFMPDGKGLVTVGPKSVAAWGDVEE